MPYWSLSQFTLFKTDGIIKHTWKFGAHVIYTSIVNWWSFFFNEWFEFNNILDKVSIDLKWNSRIHKMLGTLKVKHEWNRRGTIREQKEREREGKTENQSKNLPFTWMAFFFHVRYTGARIQQIGTTQERKRDRKKKRSISRKLGFDLAKNRHTSVDLCVTVAKLFQLLAEHVATF